MQQHRTQLTPNKQKSPVITPLAAGRLLANGRLLSGVRVADVVDDSLRIGVKLAIHHNRRNIGETGSDFSSTEHELVSFISLRASKNHIAIDVALLRAASHRFILEVVLRLHTVHHVQTLFGEVSQSTQLHLVSITLAFSVLASEGGRVLADDVRLSVGNDLQIRDFHERRGGDELLELLGSEGDAVGTHGLNEDLHLDLRCGHHADGEQSKEGSVFHGFDRNTEDTVMDEAVPH